MNEPIYAGSGKIKKQLKPVRGILTGVDFDQTFTRICIYFSENIIHPKHDTKLHQDIISRLENEKRIFSRNDCLERNPFFEIESEEILKIDDTVVNLFAGGNYVCFDKVKKSTLHCIGNISDFPEIEYVVIRTPPKDDITFFKKGTATDDLDYDKMTWANLADIVLHKPLDDYYPKKVDETAINIEIKLKPSGKYGSKSLVIPISKRSEYIHTFFSEIYTEELYRLPEKIHSHIFLVTHKRDDLPQAYNEYQYYDGYFNQISFEKGLVQAIKEHGEVPKPPKVNKKKKKKRERKTWP